MLVPGELLTEGKGKRIYATEDPDKAIVYFKDEAMAYHGLKRGRILGKGEINNAICKHIFELLAAHGVENHFIQQLDARQSLVKRVEILPLEIKVRNIVAGSLSRRIGYPVGTRPGNPGGTGGDQPYFPGSESHPGQLHAGNPDRAD